MARHRSSSLCQSANVPFKELNPFLCRQGAESQDTAQSSTGQRIRSLYLVPDVITMMLGTATSFPVHFLRSSKAAQDMRWGHVDWRFWVSGFTMKRQRTIDLERTLSFAHLWGKEHKLGDEIGSRFQPYVPEQVPLLL